MFRPVNSRVNFPKLEEDVLGSWKQNNIFAKSVANRKGGPRFNLYDGPPTLNGSPAIHHALTSIFKDVIPRYKTMKGFYAPRIGGWDTHGLPVELEIEKKLGFSGKAQIEEYGVAKFNALCRESVGKYRKEFEEIIERVGYWVDLEHPYVTMDNSYIETDWWAIKQMWDKGLIYQGYRVTPHCPRCGTSLSSHEVAQGYKDDVEDPSVYIKFKVVLSSLTGSDVRERLSKLFSDKPAYLLAWTTTPWTLPGNTALAVAADAEYAVVDTGNEYLILAEARREVVGLGDNMVVEKVKGSDLVADRFVDRPSNSVVSALISIEEAPVPVSVREAIAYETLYNPHKFGVERRRFPTWYRYGIWSTLELQSQLQEPREKLTYQLIAGDFVSMEEGTGIVHIAPAYGEVDYKAGEYDRLDFVHHVDLQGKIIGTYPFAGKFVKDADKDIITDLKERGLMFKSETIRHTYPFCWRCESPLLYYAKPAWYIRTSAVKDKLISGNAGINWYPEHIKQGRFGDWLENNVDWALSRERYWGTPMPVWQCDSCRSFECIGSVDELRNKPGFSGLKEPLDLHRPYVDETIFTCSKCGSTMKRVPEVIDCWFDSGAMPVAQHHYPFENDTLLEDGSFPADYICEAIDQTRGWFYTLHAISTLLFDRPSFKNVICLGHILDAKGEKMSKRKGNAVWPGPVIGKYGADALRWYFFTSSPPGNPRRFSEEMVAEVSRRFLSTLWNTYSFFILYANIDNFVPDEKTLRQAQGERMVPELQGERELPELDGWILSELNQLIVDVDSALDKYDPRGGAWPIATFVDNLSNWYVRRSRRRFWKSENDADKLSAYNTLYQCLVTLAKLMAPFAPFLAEGLYQNLVRTVSPGAPESVHLTDFPVADKIKINEQLAEANRLAMKVSSLGRAARSKAGIKVRQPLQVCYFDTSFERALGRESIQQMVMDEINVKELKFETSERLIAMAKQPGYVVDDQTFSTTVIDTRVTPELEAEGMAREIVHRVQGMRREAGFEIADHINTYYNGDDYIRGVMETKYLAEYITQETLSRQIIEGVPEDVNSKESFKLGGHEVLLGVKRLA